MPELSQFEKGWRVLVRVPGKEGVYVGLVGDAGRRRVDRRLGVWVWVHIDGHWELVPENKLEPKMDESYYLDFVADITRGSLSLKKRTLELKGGRVRIITPSTEKGFLKAKIGSTWTTDAKRVPRWKEQALSARYKILMQELSERAAIAEKAKAANAQSWERFGNSS